MVNIEAKNYAYQVTDSSCDIKRGIKAELTKLLTMTTLSCVDQDLVYGCLVEHLERAEGLFLPEEQERILELPFANLYYHNKHHAVYQIGYDSTSIMRAVLERNDGLSTHITNEGIVATFLGAINHDTGYVTAQSFLDNYAARTPIHVARSMEEVQIALQEIPLPSCLNQDRVSELAVAGIQKTYFPYTEEKKVEFKELLALMTLEEKKEAQIIGLVTQMADLGGQVDRKDYSPTLLRALRAEMNCANPGLGDQIIGLDREMAGKCLGFMNFVVLPTVGKSCHALIGDNNDFMRGWKDLTSEDLSKAA